MALKFLTCRSITQDDSCTVGIFGDEDQMGQLFQQHLASRHGGQNVDDADIKAQAVPVVVEQGDRLYVGDNAESDGSRVRVSGRGVYMREYDESGFTGTCKCIGGTGDCEATFEGPWGTCSKSAGSACTNCSFSIVVHAADESRFLIA